MLKQLAERRRTRLIRRSDEIEAKINNGAARAAWVAERLSQLPAGYRLLDVGAGECQYRQHCRHLDYKSQDVAIYDGRGDNTGLQTGEWRFDQIDLRCDLYDIPETTPWDAVLITEVLEHVVDPAAALQKVIRLLRPGGELILTAPFCSLTHFAPHFHATGFSRHFYEHHLARQDMDILRLEYNGDFFLYVAQEMLRARRVAEQYLGCQFDLGMLSKIESVAQQLCQLSSQDRANAENGAPSSRELLTFGLHIHARKTSGARSSAEK